MSRSRKKHSATGWSMADSEKEWKRKEQRRFRKRAKQQLEKSYEDEDLLLLEFDEISCQYDGPKDGKQYFDSKKYPNLMRK